MYQEQIKDLEVRVAQLERQAKSEQRKRFKPRQNELVALREQLAEVRKVFPSVAVAVTIEDRIDERFGYKVSLKPGHYTDAMTWDELRAWLYGIETVIEVNT